VLRCARFRAPDYDHADGLDLMSKSIYDPIGISCRICEHADFLQRAVPRLKGRLTVHRNRRSILPYDILPLSQG
jgi:hypothetical protein